MAREAPDESPFLLLELPDPCLMAVVQCLAAADQRSLCSAARSHSRLHQAAVAALRSITAVLPQQQQMDSVLLYLCKHGQHVDSVELIGVYEDTIILRELPPTLQPSSLQLGNLRLQLQPGGGFQGVLGPAAGVAALTQLQLGSYCDVLDNEPDEALAAALARLPAGLQHLSIGGLTTWDSWVQFPFDALQRLQQLTYLELAEAMLQGPGQGRSAVQLPAQPWTRLVDFLFSPDGDCGLTASMLSGANQLTRLEVSGLFRDDTILEVEPGFLAGKTQLQHLQLTHCTVSGGAAGAAQLLSHLRPLQQLTHLDLGYCVWAVEEGSPPAAAFSALTASSRLQQLDLHRCRLPAGAWQHVFPAGRQLPHLTSLGISRVKQPSDSYVPAPEGSRLVRCCPGLQSLHMQCLQYSTELLASLQSLSGLHTLSVLPDEDSTAECMQAVCQLTRLRSLSVMLPVDAAEGLLLPLAQLKQLTSLWHWEGSSQVISLTSGAPGDEPVWRRVLRLHLNHSDPAVAQQAAAALAE